MSFNQDFSISQSCDFLVSIGEPRPPNPIAFAYQFYFPPIIPGESLTCFGTFRVFFESGTRSIEWVANSLSDTDPNSSDNSHVMVFGVQPIAVPTLSFNMVVVLILVIGLFTKLHFRKAIFND